MNLTNLYSKYYWVYSHFTDHSQLVTPYFLRNSNLPSEIERILILCAENEELHDVSLGDLITREPMLKIISQIFPQAEIVIILKPYHYKLGVLPTYHNVVYKETIGNNTFIDKKFFRKTYRDIISAQDFGNRKWDIVIDSTSRDGFSLIKNIIDSIGKLKIGYLIPANILTSVWFANTINSRYRYGCHPFLPFKSHELFLIRILDKLKKTIDINCIPSNSPSSNHYNININNRSNSILSLSKSCLIVDKSPCKNKLWTSNGLNPFDDIAFSLRKLNYDIYLHRFIAPDENSYELPKYIKSSPININASLKELLEFYVKIRPELIIGIDTGVMHFMRSISYVQSTYFISIFTDKNQDPIVWNPPDSTAFSTLSGIDSLRMKFNLTPTNLLNHIK